MDLLAEPSGELIEETWAAHLIRGAKVGYRHTRVFRIPDSSPGLLQIVAVDRLELRRFGDIVAQSLRTASLETEDGQVRQLAYTVENGESITRVAGFVESSYVELTRSTPPTEETFRLTWSDQQQGIFGVERSLRRQPMSAGERRTVETFMPLIDQTVRVELVAQTDETEDVDGQPRSLLRVEAHNPASDGWQIPTLYWIDAQGA